MTVTDKEAPMKERSVKQNSHEQFNAETAYEIKNRDTLFNKFKKSKLYIDKDIYNAVRYEVNEMIFNKERTLSEKKN